MPEQIVELDKVQPKAWRWVGTLPVKAPVAEPVSMSCRVSWQSEPQETGVAVTVAANATFIVSGRSEVSALRSWRVTSSALADAVSADTCKTPKVMIAASVLRSAG